MGPRAGLDWCGKFCHHRDSKTGLEGIKTYRQQRLLAGKHTSALHAYGSSDSTKSLA